MSGKIFPGYDSLSNAAADEVISLVKQKPDGVICFASGSTPIGACEWLAKETIEQNVNF